MYVIVCSANTSWEYGRDVIFVWYEECVPRDLAESTYFQRKFTVTIKKILIIVSCVDSIELYYRGVVANNDVTITKRGLRTKDSN